ncbi:MAG: hypothetical protein ABR579_08955 [Actinomycetota bacterium]
MTKFEVDPAPPEAAALPWAPTYEQLLGEHSGVKVDAGAVWERNDPSSGAIEFMVIVFART